jgi:hypothetical protein
MDVGRFEQVPDDHFGAGGPQGRRAIILAANHGANWKPAIEEQAGDRSPDGAELTGCPGDENRSVVSHAVFSSRERHTGETPTCVETSPSFILSPA